MNVLSRLKTILDSLPAEHTSDKLRVIIPNDVAFAHDPNAPTLTIGDLKVLLSMASRATEYGFEVIPYTDEVGVASYTAYRPEDIAAYQNGEPIPSTVLRGVGDTKWSAISNLCLVIEQQEEDDEQRAYQEEKRKVPITEEAEIMLRKLAQHHPACIDIPSTDLPVIWSLQNKGYAKEDYTLGGYWAITDDGLTWVQEHKVPNTEPTSVWVELSTPDKDNVTQVTVRRVGTDKILIRFSCDKESLSYLLSELENRNEWNIEHTKEIDTNDGGWGFPALGRVWHYFESGELVSLCGKWLYGGRRVPETENIILTTKCSVCKRKKAKLQK